MPTFNKLLARLGRAAVIATVSTVFRLNPRIAVFALAFVTFAAIHSADAAVCRSGMFWDVFPISVDPFSGQCVLRNGLVGFVSPY